METVLLVVLCVMVVLPLAFSASTPPDNSGYSRYDCTHGILESLCAECKKG